jgi:dTDP-glucose 4,6-dehydratase
MKGLVLAGGTASRLFPLTIVTNKHLLPIYDRPMIYYPLDTLAGMGIREVMVIVGGKSVGDIIELLGDGRHFGLDLTYRYQRGALGIAHAIGLARDFIGNDAFCVVLGDNVLRGDPLAEVARRFEAGTWGAGTLLHRVPDPERFGVAELDPAGNVVGFEEKPARPKSDLIPIGVYFLRPDVFDVIEGLAPSGRGEFEITDVLNHYIPGGGLFAPVYEGEWTDAHLLVTGGAGFIGSELVRQVMARRDGTRITVLDKLTYAGNRANLAAVEGDPEQAARFAFVHGDIADATVVDPLVAITDAVVNVAAETHVDRSILDPEAFLRTGVIGVHVLLEAVRRETDRARAGERPTTPRFLQVSTDEVYGDIPEGQSAESDPLAPRSPYAAAKASSELLVRAYRITYDLDTVVTRGSNTYGPYQHPEKLIPLFTTNALAGEPLPMYGDGLQVRDWLHVADHAAGIDFVLRHGEPGEAYNVAGAHLLTNREVIARLLDAAGRDWSLVRSVPERPGHDRRYAMDGSRLLALGWRPVRDFEAGLAQTVAWYRDHPDWVAGARSGDWDAYYRRQYGERLAAGRPVEGGA